jgi:hypothetical protein
MRLRRYFLAVLALALVFGSSPPALAQWGPTYSAVKGMDESFRIDFGGFLQKFDTTVQLDSPNGSGTEISLENLLAQDAHKTTLRAEGYWRFGRHANLRFGYLGWNRSASTTISQDIQWGDRVFHAGAAVDSRLRVTVADLYYAYSFANTGETEVGTMFGLSTYLTSASLDASGTITGPGGTTTASYSDDTHKLTVPLPATGAYLRYTLLPGLMVEAQVKWLPNTTISGYTAGMLDYRAGLILYLTPNVGFGANYSYTSVHFSHTETNTIGLNFKYSGPYGFLSLAF